MSTTTAERVDVNAAFAAERAAQQAQVAAFNREAEAWNARPLAERQAEALAAEQARFAERVAKGELVDLGGGRFQSTEGWDRGEVWTLRQSAVGDRQLLVMPEHGLDIDEVTGRARLMTAVPAWHGLGTEIPGGLTDIDEVIAMAGIGFEVKQRAIPSYAYKGIRHQVQGQFINYRSDTGAPLGIVGKTHRTIPVRKSMEFMQDLVDRRELVFESAGCLKGGAEVFICARLPQDAVVDQGGLDDIVRTFLAVVDNRVGGASHRTMVTPWRIACANTNRFAARDAVAMWLNRHTAGALGRLELAKRTLGLTVKYVDAFAAEETALARTSATIDDFREVMAGVFTEPDKGVAVFGARDGAEESNRTRLANDRREADLEERFGVERGRAGDTLYAVEQAGTGHLDWGRVRKGDGAAARWNARIEASLAGQDDGLKTKLHERLMLKVRG